MTTNDKHLEKHEQKGGDQPLAGAQITKPEDSAVKQRQEMLDGLKSHRITKDGNAFTIDMGNGESIQDVRATKKAPGIIEEQTKPTQAQFMPDEGDNIPHTGLHVVPVGGDLPQSKPGDLTPIPTSELSKLTLKTDTTIDESGHIVTTETRADGSTFATTQAIGTDSKLHVVSTELKEATGGSTIEKFDPATGKKTEDIKDNGDYRVDTKYNSNGDPVTRDTTGGITGMTDHEEWLRIGPHNDLVIHLKNGKFDEPQLFDKNGSSDAALERGGLGKKLVEAIDAAVTAVRHEIEKNNQKYFLSDYNPPGGPHVHYDFDTYTWKDTQNKQAMPPPREAYPAPNKDAKEDAKYKNIRDRQYTCDQLMLLGYAASHAGKMPGQN